MNDAMGSSKDEDMFHVPLISLTGHDRNYYKEISAKKEKQLGIGPLYSMGYTWRDNQWINTFNHGERYRNEEELDTMMNKIGYIEKEIDDNDHELRYWITLNNLGKNEKI